MQSHDDYGDDVHQRVFLRQTTLLFVVWGLDPVRLGIAWVGSWVQVHLAVGWVGFRSMKGTHGQLNANNSRFSLHADFL